MRRLFIYILHFAFSVTFTCAQIPHKKAGKADGDSQAPVKQKTIVSSHADSKEAGDESYKKYVSAKKIVKELNSIMGHLEILNKPEKPEVYASSQTAGSYSIPAEKPNVVLRLRIINADSLSDAPLECKLVIDSVGYSHVYLKKIKDSVRYIDARMRANNKEVLIKLHGFKSSPANNYTAGISNKNISADSNNFTKKLPYLLAIIGGILLFAWAINRLTGNTLFTKKTAVDSTFTNSAVDIEPAAVASSIPDKNTVTDAPVLAAKYAPAPVSSLYFLSEIMMTSGPRKKYISDANADKDLGEDVCGFISTGKNIFFWLLDGTSDQYCLKDPDSNREYFSSRLLAQSIAGKMRQAFSKKDKSNISGQITNAVVQVKNEWLHAIENLPVEEKETIKKNIAARNSPECAATLLFAHLSIDGNLSVFRSGDSKMFLYNASTDGRNNYVPSSLSNKNTESNDRLFFRLIVNADGQIDILYNQPKFEIVNMQNVETVIAFSDGVGMETETYLKQQRYSEKVRDEIILQVQGTADDKSICFIEIRDENINR